MNMPIAGDLVATAMCYNMVISLAILYVQLWTTAMMSLSPPTTSSSMAN